MATLAYDELNNREYARPTNKAIPYEQYFGEMDLDEEEIEERIAMAEDLEDVFKFLFAIIAASKALEAELQQTELAESTAIRYRDVVEDFGYDINEDYPYLDGYIGTVTDDIVENTLEHLTDGYYTSDDRAMFIAENETNAVKNYVGLIDAIKAGFTTKRWVTMGDRKVRHTHRLVDGEEVGILDDFEVGNAKMLFPKDASRGAGAEEIVNCRCTLVYGDKTQRESHQGSLTKNVQFDMLKKEEALKKGSLSNEDVRRWYIEHDKMIPDMIDRSGTLEEQARQACELRNRFRNQARDLMADQELRRELDQKRPNKSFEELLADKMDRKGLSREQAIQDILETSTKTNSAVNKRLGIEG